MAQWFSSPSRDETMHETIELCDRVAETPRVFRGQQRGVEEEVWMPQQSSQTTHGGHRQATDGHAAAKPLMEIVQRASSPDDQRPCLGHIFAKERNGKRFKAEVGHFSVHVAYARVAPAGKHSLHRRIQPRPIVVQL